MRSAYIKRYGVTYREDYENRKMFVVLYFDKDKSDYGFAALAAESEEAAYDLMPSNLETIIVVNIYDVLSQIEFDRIEFDKYPKINFSDRFSQQTCQ